MKVIIDIPTNPNEEVIYRNGVSFCGGFRAKVEENFKLANLCYNLAQENVDDYRHIHVDKDGLWLLEGSESIIMVRVNNLE